MFVTLLHPEALALLTVIPYLYLAAEITRRHDAARVPQLNARASLLVRSFVIAWLALALARPQLAPPTRDLAAVVLTDQSAALSAGQRAAAETLIAAVRDRAGRGTRVIVHPLDDNLATALRLGAAQVPAGVAGRLLLVSDGLRPPGDAPAAARQIAQQGMPVSTVTLQAEDRPEILIRALDAPSAGTPGATANLIVAIESTRVQRASLALYRNGLLLSRQDVEVRRGSTAVRVPTTLSESGLLVFTAAVDAPLDTRRENNRACAVTTVRGRARVLLVEDSEGEAPYLRRALEAEQFDVQSRPPAGLPAALADLNAFDLVILSDVPATAFDRRQMEALAAYVRDLGGGLVMIGGPNAFGPGGWFGTPVAALLPVRLETPQREELPGLALALVIDKSGSMSADRKIDLAKEAAIAAAEVLTPTDHVAVITFDGASHVLLPPAPARDKAALTGAIARLTAGGGTAICPALEDAHRLLAPLQAKLKHAILLSDGRSAPGDFPALLARLTADRITLSTVAIGAGADTDLLRDLAQSAGGRAYFTNDPLNIPQIFTKETLAAARRALVETPFVPCVVRPSRIIVGLGFGVRGLGSERDERVTRPQAPDPIPLLLGYVVTQPRPDAETILASEAGDPLLARCRVGLGTVAAFTSDAKNRWAAEWLDTPLFGRFWTQVARDAMRSEPGAGGQGSGIRFEIAVTPVVGGSPRARIVVDALDLRDEFVNDLTLFARVVGPGPGLGATRPSGVPDPMLRLPQSAPGRYEVEFPTPRPGAYAVQTFIEKWGLTPFSGPQPNTSAAESGASAGLLDPTPQTPDLISGPSAGFIQRESPESLSVNANAAIMRRIAEAGGGQSIELAPASDAAFHIPHSALDSLLAVPVSTAASPRDLWPMLLAAALVLFVLDVFLKRVPLDMRRGRY